MSLPVSTTEVMVQRTITSAFIATQPVVINLVPRTRNKQASGGYKFQDQPSRGDQVMRLIEPPTPAPVLRASDGNQAEVEFILLAEFDAAIGKFDHFEHDDDHWEVVQLYFFNGWERRAAVVRYAS